MLANAKIKANLFTVIEILAYLNNCATYFFLRYSRKLATRA
ncbi:hypothetical protein JCM19302_114 [Jejuia pallidilutea]|uniref:Uncharacterized protein n=1 Tax=Jejuia pallidilutea TaxID=504487 RepID=A0A090W5E4_9FLAO|nr:hypothetical protein JCM19302_114 [Jejuia pallidilutea]GAL90749.1 hypothetical protein JCM19538_514 [Jejuia pallidilutea]